MVHILFYWVSIVHVILPSFTLPPTAPGHKKQKQTVPRADKKSRWVVKYSAVYVESKNTFRFAQSSGCRNGKPVDCKYTVVQSWAEEGSGCVIIYLFIYLSIQAYCPYATVLSYERPTPHLVLTDINIHSDTQAVPRKLSSLILYINLWQDGGLQEISFPFVFVFIEINYILIKCIFWIFCIS
jgi:hypothetical protein